MSVRLWHPAADTPGVVVRHGWRDERYNGVDQCGVCHGWGTRSALIGEGKDRRNVHRTCDTCKGKGHK